MFGILPDIVYCVAMAVTYRNGLVSVYIPHQFSTKSVLGALFSVGRVNYKKAMDYRINIMRRNYDDTMQRFL